MNLVNHSPQAEERLNEPPPPEIEAFLSEPYLLDAEKIDEYRQNGHVKLGSFPKVTQSNPYRRVKSHAHSEKSGSNK